MIADDQLTRNERIRLEALVRVQGMSSIVPENWEVFKAQAEKVEAWLKASDFSNANKN